MSRAGVLDEDLLRMISLNSRSAEERWLDIKVQAAANERGARLMRELAQTLGADKVDALVEDLFAYTAQRLRNRIAEMQDGTASFRSSIESDGVGPVEVPIQANVTVRGDRLIVDFEGTGPQARGGLNVVASALNASVYYVVKTLRLISQREISVINKLGSGPRIMVWPCLPCLLMYSVHLAEYARAGPEFSQ